MSGLPERALHSLVRWLPAQRWFGGSSADGLRIVSDRPLAESLRRTVLEVGDANYQLLVGADNDPPEYLRAAVFAEVDGVRYYDATQDPDLSGLLLGVAVEPEPGVELDTALRARVLAAEQSNSSLVFGQDYILKLFRKVHRGSNRDVELHRALAGVGCAHIAAPLGVSAAEGMVFGFLQQFLPDAADGWVMSTASVRDLMVEADLHADEVGGDFAGEAARLGQA
ncbi:MAG: maltokinase N-terminal cap-like domain-containing protein, partial [Sciscionella sp.]